MVSFHTMNDFVILPCSNGVESAKLLAAHIHKISNEEINSMQKIKKNVHEERHYEYLRYMNETTKFIPCAVKYFKDGEILPTVPESVRGKNVYIVQNTFNPEKPDDTSKNIIELNLTIDAVKRASPASVIVVVPYLSYSKQERRQGRQSISAKVMLDNLSNAGANKLIVMDLHAPAIEGFTSAKDMSIDPLYASPVFKGYLQDIDFKGVLVAPDAGAAKTVKHYSKAMDLDLGLGYKTRSANSTHSAETQGVFGEYKNRDAALIDDQISTGGTLYNAAIKLKEKGAKSVRVFATVGLFTGDAEALLLKAKEDKIIDEVIVTNALQYSNEFKLRNPHIKVLDVMSLFARSIYALQTGGSISGLYDPKLRISMFGDEHKI